MIPADLLAAVRHDLRRDEGVRRSAYQDSQGYWTIGCGRMIDARLGGGLSDDEIDYLLTNDISRAYAQASAFPWFATLDAVRQRVIVELCFNMSHRIHEFHRMLSALAVSDFATAASELSDSAWFQQVRSRGPRLVEMLSTGRA